MADDPEIVTYRHDPTHLPLLARRLVFSYIKDRLDQTDLHITFSEDEVKVVWFAFTLGNWKALTTTTLPDGRYYEVTYDKSKDEAYIDTYVKINNVAVKMRDVNTPT